MKTFLAVFFAILAAAGVIYLIVYFNAESERHARISTLKTMAVAAATLCKDKPADDTGRQAAEAEIKKDMEAIEQLKVGDSDLYSWENVFQNQVLVAGCFRPDLPKLSHARRRRFLSENPNPTEILGPWAEATFSSDPEGATVVVDGRQIDRTPFGWNFHAGEHTVLMTMKGYIEWSGKMNLVAGRSEQVNAQLQKKD